MLANKPAAKDREAVLALETDDDRLAIEGRELYWLPSGGISGIRARPQIDRQGPGKGTMRTMGTIEQIAAKHCAD